MVNFLEFNSSLSQKHQGSTIPRMQFVFVQHLSLTASECGLNRAVITEGTLLAAASGIPDLHRRSQRLIPSGRPHTAQEAIKHREKFLHSNMRMKPFVCMMLSLFCDPIY